MVDELIIVEYWWVFKPPHQRRKIIYRHHATFCGGWKTSGKGANYGGSGMCEDVRILGETNFRYWHNSRRCPGGGEEECVTLAKSGAAEGYFCVLTLGCSNR